MKNNDLFIYPAIFTEEDGQYWVEFIDLKGCYSNGNSLSEAMENAKEAMGLHLEGLLEFPEATELKKIKLKKNQVASYVTLDTLEYKKKYSNASIKKTLSIPAWLNTMAEKNNINFSQVLQEALKVKLKINKK